MVDQEARPRSRFFDGHHQACGLRPLCGDAALRRLALDADRAPALMGWPNEFRPSGLATENRQLRAENRELRTSTANWSYPICARISLASAAGSFAPVIGRPTTM